MRDRLIELLIKAKVTWNPCGIADHLLSNGVIVPPCKVGDTVWFETYEKNGSVFVGIQPHTVDRIDVDCVVGTQKFVETRLPSWSFGKTVFLTKEGAEQALKERDG